jgi:serine protease Do
MTALLAAMLVAQAASPGHMQSKPKKPPPKAAEKPAAPPQPAPLCPGDYADALPAEKASAILDSVKQPFVFAIRNTATYEHVYYGHDGKLRRAYLRSVVHGTGFGWKVVNGETQVVTNEHVASQPDVLGKVLSDPAADLAVLKAKKTLSVMPWRVGRSSALRAGNLVYVRGFPLGAFAALNMGKVLNPMTADTERSWDHADFVVDALLNAGNSGSPVFAISCRTAEPELVGVYHAGYTDAAALNAVIAIDQLHDELDTLKVPHRDPANARSDVTAQDRDRLVKQLFDEPTHSLTFPYASRAVVVTLTDPQTLRFSVLDDDYPLVMQESMALIDQSHNGFGTLDSIGVSVDGAPTEAPAQALDQDVREHFERLYDSLWRQVLGVVDYRARLARGSGSADAFADAQAARQRIKKRAVEQKEILNICTFEADRGNFGAARTAAAPAQAAPAKPDVALSGSSQ